MLNVIASYENCMNKLIILYNNSENFLANQNKQSSAGPHPNEYDLKGYESLNCAEEIVHYVSYNHHVFLSIANDIQRDVNDIVILKLDINIKHLQNNIMLLAGNIKNNMEFNVRVAIRDSRTFEEKVAEGCDFPDKRRGTPLHNFVLSDLKIGKEELENYDFTKKLDELKKLNQNN